VCSGTSYYQYTLTNVLRQANYQTNYELTTFFSAVNLFWELIHEYGLAESDEGKKVVLVGMIKRGSTRLSYDLDTMENILNYEYEQIVEGLSRANNNRKVSSTIKERKPKEESAKQANTQIKFNHETSGNHNNGCEVCERLYGNRYRHKGPHDYSKDKKSVKQQAKTSETDTSDWDKIKNFFSAQEQRMNQLSSNMAALQRSFEDERAINLAAERLKEKQTK
jgi:hypothetical protein